MNPRMKRLYYLEEHVVITLSLCLSFSAVHEKSGEL